MTVYINGRFLAQPLTGVQRVARALTDALLARRGDIAILTPPDACDPPKHWPIRRTGRMTGYLWEQTCLPMAARDGALLSLCNLGPVLHGRQVLMIHDTATLDRPENFSRAMTAAYRVLLPILGRSVRRILTVSAFSKARLTGHGIAEPGRITVVPNGVDHILRASPKDDAPAGFGLVPNGYVLAVGSTSHNKNLGLVVDALRRLGPSAPVLALVGGGADARVFAATRGLDDERVVSVGTVDDATLAGLYAGAACLVFPSRYEGFGLPPLEAMALGCPAIAADIPALREVCGDAALFCDPDDAGSLSSALARLRDEPGLRDSIVAKGLERSSHYRWHKAAEAVSTVLDAVI